MAEEMDREALERRIAKLRKKREQLGERRAEKVAQLKSSQEELRRLRDEASEHGWDLKNLSEVLADKKRALNAEVALFEDALEEVEAVLDGYEV